MSDDHLQIGIGPYRLYDFGDGNGPVKFLVGAKDFRTWRNLPPNDGRPYLIDDPVLGTVVYDGQGRRVVNAPSP